MRNVLGTTALIFSVLSTNTFATEYIFRDLMANSLPTVKCAEKSEAISMASKAYTMDRYSKKFCQTQGYGWHLEAIKDSGKPVCNECTNDKGKHQCFVQDIVVTCKRIKPGSVGMLPGQS